MIPHRMERHDEKPAVFKFPSLDITSMIMGHIVLGIVVNIFNYTLRNTVGLHSQHESVASGSEVLD